jgi:hypothetical protein
VSNIEEIEDAMGVIGELTELSRQQHNAASEQHNEVSECLKEFKSGLRDFDKQTDELGKAGDNLQAKIEQAVALGVMASLRPAIETSLDNTSEIVESALNPIFQRLDIAADTAKRSTEHAEKANARLNRAVLALGWKMAGIACGVAGVLVLSVYLAVWWNRAELESLTTQKAAMEKNIEELSKRKGDVTFSFCGKNNRPCVEVESKAYGDEKHPLYILKGVY